MKDDNRGLDCKAANAFDLVSFLSRLGYEPNKVRGHDYWYHSPLREERTPSFKVNRRLNCWYDHGEGTGGTLVDFGIRYYGCSISAFLGHLSGTPDLCKPPLLQPLSTSPEAAPALQICEVRPLCSLVLRRYLHSRHIPLALAQKYLREVVFEIKGKRYAGLGFPNRSGGYEIRNGWFKGSSAPKDIFLLPQRGRELAVFEGFFDFLSFLSLQQKGAMLRMDFLVLNSLSFVDKSLDLLRSYPQVRLYLDNDPSGDTRVGQILKSCPGARDKRKLYAGYKDLNEWHMHMGKGRRLGQRPSFRPP
ncbi:MAG: primase [Flaviaesturariibacter sp.]|nr:primase [Flaviaesturariibacter sp.]